MAKELRKMKKVHFPEYGARYPKGNKKLKPGMPEHDRIVRMLLDRVEMSYSHMNTRHKQWREIDKKLTSYIPLNDAEKATKSLDSRKPMSVVVPMSFATLDTLMTYMVAVFLDDPIFKYEGFSPEDVASVYLLQQVIERNSQMQKLALNLHTQFRDNFTYGFGAVACKWFSNDYQVPNGRSVRLEGNDYFNLSPYHYFPDPHAPIDRPNNGEFVAWLEKTNYLDLLSEEENSPKMFNTKYLDAIQGCTTNIVQRDPSGRETRFGTSEAGGRVSTQDSVTRPVDVFNFYIKIIPWEWGLGTKRTPENWTFRVGADRVLLMATPTNLAHGRFPIGIIASETDGYSTAPLSRIELDYGLQEAIDWLFSSHIHNVRKAVNDVLIVDPSLVNMKDVLDPKPGGLIRLKSTAWGKGIDGAIKQLSISDVTQGNVADVRNIMEMNNIFTGTSDSSMGINRKTSARITATEFAGTHKSALSRLERIAKIISLQGMSDLAYITASHVQQFMSDPTWVRILGDYPMEIGKMYQEGPLQVKPDELLVPFDVVAKDGTSPVSGVDDPAVWAQLMPIIQSNPELAQQFDSTKILLEAMRTMGVKNPTRLKRVETQVLPDDQVEAQAQAGNIVPTGDVPDGGL